MAQAAPSGKHEFVFEPWPIGTRFLIRNQTLGGRPLIEGRATIRKELDADDNLYEVEFDSEPGVTYPRRVDGGDMLVKCPKCRNEIGPRVTTHGPGPNGEFVCPGSP